MSAISSDLLKQTYRCANAPALWPDTLARLSDELGATSILVQRARRGASRMRTCWAMSDPAAIRQDFLGKLDDETNPRMESHLSPPIAGVAFFRDEERLDREDPHVRRLHRLEAEFGYASFLGARTELSVDETLLVAIYRSGGASTSFGANEEALLHEYLPHLGQAVTLTGEIEALGQWRRSAIEALDRVAFGLVLLDRQGNIVLVNRAADAALSGSALQLCANGIEATGNAERQRLRSVLGRTSSGETCGARFGTGDSAVDVMVVPFFEPAGGTMLLVSRAGQRQSLPTDPICEIHGLTGAEAALASALCSGMSLQEYAGARGISICTARSQLRQVLAKTGAARQSDLVRMVWTSAIAAGAMPLS